MEAVAGASSVDQHAPLRVLVVDDIEDVRVMLRLQLRLDGRFDVVGEAADGNEAIAKARELRPDLVIMDRNMPGRGGIEAIAPIRAVAPDTAVVLYTAEADTTIHHKALAAGAIDVLTKAGGPEFVDRFTNALLDRAQGRATDIEVRVGPVPMLAARVWITNTRSIIRAVSEHPEVVSVPRDVLDLFEELLDEWDEAARAAGEFVWVARAPRDEVAHIVEQWAVIDAMTDAQLDALGIRWSPPEGQPFFEALTTGVLQALERDEETLRLAERLNEQWAPYRQAPGT